MLISRLPLQQLGL